MLPPEATCHDLIGDDAIVRIVNEDTAIIENVDVFTPIHDDPFTQGRIVACNATNDVFAMGATNLISLQAFLAYPPELPQDIPVGILKGMNSFLEEIGSSLTGGQTIKNPVPVFGGIALGVISPNKVIYSKGARPGDVVILTKPLGIQPAMRSYRDLQDEKRESLLREFAEDDLKKMQDTAVRIMTKSNLEVALAMQEHNAHAATDVTGFGLLGHANNVASLSCVDIVIDRIPVIAGSLDLARFYGHRLAQGYGAETAGGMLVFLDAANADDFLRSLKKQGLPAWQIGEVSVSSKDPKAVLSEQTEFIETDFP